MARLIDADALFEPVDFSIFLVGGNRSGKTAAMYEKLFRKRIELAPTVDAVPVVHGRWEQGDFYDYGDVCSVCDWDSEINNCKWSYCPNCGSAMRERSGQE